MTEEIRPNPEQLLKAIHQEETKEKKGHLKIFLGMSAGVGKTYAMLEEAQKLKALNIDVCVGVVETHGRQETAKLLENLEVIPQMEITYRDAKFKELDLDRILTRKPALVLVDELAHTNVPGSRHAKRWQDVVEILEDGIDVYSTLNVQHIESLRDNVENIAEIPIRETVPDLVIELADSIELVDITPAALLQRLKEGKVYLGERSEIAQRHFFKEDRLAALREMALRFAAEKVDHDLKEMVSFVEKPFGWKTRERLLVAVSPHEHSQKLIRTTRRLAFNLNAPWIALYVNQGEPLSDEALNMLDRNIALARDLGGEVITTSDPDIAVAIHRVAKQHGVTQIVLGHPPKSRFFGYFFRNTLLDRLSDRAEDIDIHIIRRIKSTGVSKSWFLLKSRFSTMVVSFIFLALFALANWLLVEDLTWFLGLYVFLGIGLGLLIDRIRTQGELLAKREATARSLYEISKEISSAPSVKLVLPMVKRELETILDGKCEFIIKKMEGGLDFSTSDLASNEKEQAVATWVFDNETEAGWSTATLPNSRYYYIPIKGFTEGIGVLAFRSNKDKKLPLEIKNFLHTTGFQIASHIERIFTQRREQSVSFLNQKEKIYHTILDLISEQFGRPLEAINQIVSQMESNEQTEKIKVELTTLFRILENITAMSKLRSGLSPASKEAFSIEEVIEASHENTLKALGTRPLRISIEPNLPKMVFDFYLIEIVICNLIFNAIEHSPPGSPIELEAREEEGILILSVTDHGRTLSPDRATALFEKFYRLPDVPKASLEHGLSVARTIAEIHGGVLIVSTPPTGGTKIALHLPIQRE